METLNFPLNTVLFPGGTLQLRVFGALSDMTKACLRDSLPSACASSRKASQ